MQPPEMNTEHGTRKASLNKEGGRKVDSKVGTRNTAVAPVGHRRNNLCHRVMRLFSFTNLPDFDARSKPFSKEAKRSVRRPRFRLSDTIHPCDNIRVSSCILSSII